MEENKKQDNTMDTILTIGLIASSVLLVYTLGMRKGYKLAIKTVDDLIYRSLLAIENF